MRKMTKSSDREMMKRAILRILAKQEPKVKRGPSDVDDVAGRKKPP